MYLPGACISRSRHKVLREQAREKERLSRALRRMLEAEVSKRRTFAKLTLQTKAEAEGVAAILRDDPCEGLECRTVEVCVWCVWYIYTKYLATLMSGMKPAYKRERYMRPSCL